MENSKFHEAYTSVESALYVHGISSIQQYLDTDATTIHNKIEEIVTLTGIKRPNVIRVLFRLAGFGYPVHQMSLYQLHVAGFEVYWNMREHFKESYDLVDKINIKDICEVEWVD